MNEQQYLNAIFTPIESRLGEYLKADLQVSVQKMERLDNPQSIMLKNFTVNIGLGGAISVLFVVSYDESVIVQLANAFAYGDIAEDEVDEVRESVASEIANIVLGNSIPYFPDGGRGVTMTPPLVIHEAKSISTGRQSKIATVVIDTDWGQIAVSIVWPYNLMASK